MVQIAFHVGHLKIEFVLPVLPSIIFLSASVSILRNSGVCQNLVLCSFSEKLIRFEEKQRQLVGTPTAD